MRDIICDERHHQIADYYSEHEEYKKLVEEVQELWDVINPYSTTTPGFFDKEKFVEEGADVINTVIHVAIQRELLGDLMDAVDFKLARQIGRMNDASLQEVADQIRKAGVEKEVIKLLKGEEESHA